MSTIGSLCRVSSRVTRSAGSLRTSIGPLRGGAASPIQRRCISVGDRIPSVKLKEDSPGVDVNLADELAGKSTAIIVGVPGAFSPGCSAQHVPGYLEKLKNSSVKDVYVVSVNDAFTIKAWKETFADSNTTGVRFLADPTGEFAQAMGMTFDKSISFFGNLRNKRYAAIVKDGKVSKLFEEPDDVSVHVSAAEKVLEGL